jgi:putative membrane protein insertion efficiency factor
MTTKLVLLLIKVYQLAISPYIRSQCRFIPTCSRYSSEAISRYGVLRGFRIMTGRLARCTPWGGQGFDPVP